MRKERSLKKCLASNQKLQVLFSVESDHFCELSPAVQKSKRRLLFSGKDKNSGKALVVKDFDKVFSGHDELDFDLELVDYLVPLGQILKPQVDKQLVPCFSKIYTDKNNKDEPHFGLSSNIELCLSSKESSNTYKIVDFVDYDEALVLYVDPIQS